MNIFRCLIVPAVVMSFLSASHLFAASQGNSTIQSDSASNAGASISTKAVKVVCLGYDRSSLSKALKIKKIDDILKEYDEAKVLVNTIDNTGVVASSREIQRIYAEKEQELRQLLPQVGPYVYRHIGSGFLVGEGRQYIVTNFHVAIACHSSSTFRTQIGIIEPSPSGDISAILADSMLYRPHSDAEKRANGEVEFGLPKTICAATDKCELTGEYDKRTKEVNLKKPSELRHYLPDVAILKLRTKSSLSPMIMDLEYQLQPGEALDQYGFPGAPLQALQADDSNRLSTSVPLLTSARFNQKTTFGNKDSLGTASASDLFSQEMLLISAPVMPGNSGGPLLNKLGNVVGVVTQSIGVPDQTASYGQATPVIMVKSVLDFLGITEEVVGKRSLPLPVDPCKLQPELCKPEPVSFLDKVKTWLSTTTNQAILAIGVLCLAAAGAIGWMRLSSGSNRCNEEVERKRREEAERQRLKEEAEHKRKQDEISQRNADQNQKENISFSLKLSNAGATRGEIAFPTPKKLTTLIAGRDPKSAHFVFDADATDVGRLHAQFTWSESHNKLFVEDLKSTNGTFVNGTRIQNNTMVELKSGDTVDLGIAGKNRFTVRKH